LSACRHGRRRAPDLKPALEALRRSRRTVVLAGLGVFWSNGIAPHGVHLGGVDWDKLGSAFGADTAVVETEQALTNAFAAALKSSGATLIAARIDASGYVAQFNALWEL
jgi:thiamine pyrophosphate-dependent acetolactate synthase large subunit-like protein